ADALDAEPRVFTGIDHVFDGTFVAIAGDQDAPTWAMAARILADLRDATGTEAPQSIKDLFAEPGRGDPPPGAPRRFNETMNQAVFCNEDLGRRDFDSAWTAYRKAVKKYPVTGRLHATTPPCAGWTIPPEPVRLRDSGTPLVLSGHRYETLSPYEWTWDMQDEVGGKVMTVNDDVHGSALMSPDCANRIAEFFETGRVRGRTCVGAPGAPEETATFALGEGAGFRF
ncbi:MAG TPA: alpha/beta hydrolase, partial [Phytomonospora sp.]